MAGGRRLFDPLQGLQATGAGGHPDRQMGQVRLQHADRDRVVIHQQHREAVEPLGQHRCGWHGREAEPGRGPEGGACPDLAAGFDGALHQSQQVAADGEAEARAAVMAGGGELRLLEGLEEVGQLALADADSGVAHFNAEPDALALAFEAADVEQDLAELGEFGGIGEQVQQHLPQAQRITIEMGWHGLIDQEQQLQALVEDLLGDQAGEVRQHRVEQEIGAFEAHPAGLDLGEIEDVIDDRQEFLAGTIDLADVILQSRLRVRAQGQVGEADDGVHRRAQFVAHPREELAFGCIGLFRHPAGLDQFEFLAAAAGDVFP